MSATHAAACLLCHANQLENGGTLRGNFLCKNRLYHDINSRLRLVEKMKLFANADSTCIVGLTCTMMSKESLWFIIMFDRRDGGWVAKEAYRRGGEVSNDDASHWKNM